MAVYLAIKVGDNWATSRTVIVTAEPSVIAAAMHAFYDLIEPEVDTGTEEPPRARPPIRRRL